MSGEQHRLYGVVVGTLGLSAADVIAWAAQLAGPGARRLRLTDAHMDAARAGAEVQLAAAVPVGTLSETFRRFLRTSPPRIYVGLHIHPWLRQTGTTTVTLEDGSTVEQPVYEREGTLVDLLLRPEQVDVAALEDALFQVFPGGVVTRSDGTDAQAAQTPIGILLVRAADVRTPAVVYARWEEPPVVLEPELPPEGPST